MGKGEEERKELQGEDEIYEYGRTGERRNSGEVKGVIIWNQRAEEEGSREVRGVGKSDDGKGKKGKRGEKKSVERKKNS